MRSFGVVLGLIAMSGVAVLAIVATMASVEFAERFHLERGVNQMEVLVAWVALGLSVFAAAVGFISIRRQWLALKKRGRVVATFH